MDTQALFVVTALTLIIAGLALILPPRLRNGPAVLLLLAVLVVVGGVVVLVGALT